jgi:acetyl esterase/lipase
MRYAIALVTIVAILAGICGTSAAAGAAEPVRLSIWPENKAPVGDGTFETAEVPITVHLPAPEKATGAAMVICPGGGYGGLMEGPEGHGIAKWLNDHGIAGIVLKYRLPKGRYRVPMLDAQRAIRVVRSHAAEWKIDPKRIGIIGFSAGGHLASTAATHFDAGDEKAADPVDRMSCRPDFVVLVYPVITMGEKTHGGSRTNLMGPTPAAEIIDLMSNEKQVTDRTPPTFLTHAKTDSVVPVEHSRMFYEALKQHGVKAEYLEFEQGTHGYSGYKGKEWDAWQEACIKWVKGLEQK